MSMNDSAVTRRGLTRRKGVGVKLAAVVLGVGLAVAGLVTGAPVASADTVIGNCTIVSSPTPTAHTVCPGVDLTGSDLSNLDFSYADLTGAKLYQAKLTSANLTGAKLIDANLTLAKFYGGANLSYVDLTGADMYGVYLDFVNLTSANLTNAKLTYPIMNSVNLTGANLTGADLTGADVSDTLLIPTYQQVSADQTGNATVTWPTPPNLTGTAFGGCDRASGSSFPPGWTTVRCTVNTSVSQASGTFIVDVTEPVSNPEPTLPGNLFGS
ncbi:MAG: pentapeptide repeat-containing protein [Comamonadaceae bacterium]|nr:MAG: pentapeptide repeat-containing protein [Comamonadaceae bacterium]